MRIGQFLLTILPCLFFLLPPVAGVAHEAAGNPEISHRERSETLELYEADYAGVEYPYTFGPIITDTAIPVPRGQFQIQPTFGLGLVTNNFTRNWRRVSAGGDYQSFSMDWKLTYGLIDNLEGYLVIPYVHNWASNVNERGPQGQTAANFGSLGDINVNLKYRLVTETNVIPTVSAFFSVDFPTGNYKHLNPGNLNTDNIGAGGYAFTAGFNLSKSLPPFVFYGNFNYGMQTAFTDDGGRKYPRDIVTVNLAAELPITKKWVALLEMVSLWDGGRLFGHRASEIPDALLGLAPGIEYMATDRFSLALGVRYTILGKNNFDKGKNLTVTPLLSLTYIF